MWSSVAAFVTVTLFLVTICTISRAADSTLDEIEGKEYATTDLHPTGEHVERYLQILAKKFVQTPDNHFVCALYQHFHPEFGVAIYAGRPYLAGEILERSVGIPLLKKYHTGISLDSYVEGLNETHSTVSLGYAMLYNHAPFHDVPRMMEKFNAPLPNLMDLPPPVPLPNSIPVPLPNSEFIDIHYVAARDIQEGEQIFQNYGDGWFESRQQKEILPKADIGGEYCLLENPAEQAEHRNRIPGCAISATVVRSGRVFATRKVLTGEVLEMSRVLMLPAAHFEGAVVFERFLWRHNDGYENPRQHPLGEYAALLMGWGAMYGPPLPGQEPNIDYNWWDPTRSDPQTGHFYPIRLKQECSERMFISFVANRDIQPGEELTIDIRVDPVYGFKFARPGFSQYCLRLPND